MIYGYARCSTNESKQDINRQIRELNALGVSRENIFFEYGSGTKVDRQELNRLLSIVVPGDTIATLEASRLSRSTKQLIEIIELVKDKGLKLIIGTMIIDCTNADIDPMTKAMLQMMGIFAELERDIISQRVKSGLENARSKGKVIGRRATTIDDIPPIFLKHYPKLINKSINKSEFSRIIELSRPTIDKYIKIMNEENK